MNCTELDGFRKEKTNLPEIIIVKKTYPRYRKRKNKNRNWKLKHLDKREGGPDENEQEALLHNPLNDSFTTKKQRKKKDRANNQEVR